MPDHVTIVIPVKGLDDGKSRLASVLGAADRRRLNDRLARHVIGTAVAANPDGIVCVVSPDPAIRDLATGPGARFVLQNGGNLNAGLAQAAASLPQKRTVYIAADLPEVSAGDIRILCGNSGIAICPDEAGTGTNALCVPSPETIPFLFGTGSFDAHAAAAEKTGLPVDVIRRPGLMFDLDTKDELSRLRGWQ